MSCPTRTRLLACALVLLSSPAAFAQIRIAGAISGTLLDSADLVVPGATVQFEDEATGGINETISNESGSVNAVPRAGNQIR